MITSKMPLFALFSFFFFQSNSLKFTADYSIDQCASSLICLIYLGSISFFFVEDSNPASMAE